MMVQSDDVSIEQQAETLMGPSASLTDYVYRVIGWVHAHITYGYAGPRSASDAYAQRRGSCEGMTNLCLALLRAEDIPCGFASGWSLEGTQVYAAPNGGPEIDASASVDLHGWGVVWWQGTWVEFDPTGPFVAIATPQRMCWTIHPDSDQAMAAVIFKGPPGALLQPQRTFSGCYAAGVPAVVRQVTNAEPVPTVLQYVDPSGPSMSPPGTVGVASEPAHADRRHALLVDRAPELPPGWRLFDALGRAAASGAAPAGVYFATDGTAIRKIVVVK
jgi:hypothetical protein